jgi:hypothetical protein
MPMATTIRRLVPGGGAIVLADALEPIAREALRDLEEEALTVTFRFWESADGAQFVCRVETPPGDPLGNEPPWRWWSLLCRTPEEMRAQLEAMVARRLGAEAREMPSASDAAGAAASS